VAAGGGGEEAWEESEDLSAGSAQPCDQYDNLRFITVINLTGNFWRIDRSTLVFSGKRPLGKKPLIDLPAMQALLRSGTFDLDRLWIATDKCSRDMENEEWSTTDVLHMLAGLDATDYKKSEWCQVLGGDMVPCDVYVTPYDALHQQRRPHGLDVYLKFSIDDAGQLTITMVSCHA
jgi:hypothetical protein